MKNDKSDTVKRNVFRMFEAKGKMTVDRNTSTTMGQGTRGASEIGQYTLQYINRNIILRKTTAENLKNGFQE